MTNTKTKRTEVDHDGLLSLIAERNELLEALKECQNRIGELMEGRTFESDKSWNMALKAISKAEGGL